MADKFAAKGATLTINAVAIPSFRAISSSGGEAERIDVTTHDSAGAYREFVSGFKGEQSVGVEILWDPGDAAHIGLKTLFDAGTVVTVIVGLPQATPAATITFSAYIASFPIPPLPIDGAIALTFTLQVSGAIVVA